MAERTVEVRLAELERRVENHHKGLVDRGSERGMSNWQPDLRKCPNCGLMLRPALDLCGWHPPLIPCSDLVRAAADIITAQLGERIRRTA